MAQSVAHLTPDPGVASSNPSRISFFKFDDEIVSLG